MNMVHAAVMAAYFGLLLSVAGSSVASLARSAPAVTFRFADAGSPLAIEARPASVVAHAFSAGDARLMPADPFSSRGAGPRARLTHALVPPDIYARIKSAAAHNPFAPVDPFARPVNDGLETSPGLTPNPITTFPGLTDLDVVEPPDMALAVSPRWVAQGVNDHFAVFNRSGLMQNGWPKSFMNFFHVPSPGSCDPVPFLSDPRAVYIVADQRFVLAALQVDGPIIHTSCAPLSKYWLAISKTSNPNGGWFIYTFDMRLGTTNVADFTQLGYDANGLYLSGNMFDTSGFFAYAEILGAPKARMEAGLPVTAHGFTQLKAGGSIVDTVQPVASLTQPAAIASAPVEYFINSKNILNCSAVCNGVTVWAFANVLGAPSLSAATVATTSYSTPPFAVQPVGFINTDDQRISATPTYQAGAITFGLNTAISHGTSSVAGIFWGQVMPKLSGNAIVGASMLQSGYLSFSGDRSAFYPALAPDSRGDVLVAFGSSSSLLNASAYYAGRTSSATHGTLGAARQLFKGQSFYSFGRWGDYTAIAIDGTSATSKTWMAIEFTDPSTDWATEIGATRFP